MSLVSLLPKKGQIDLICSQNFLKNPREHVKQAHITWIFLLITNCHWFLCATCSNVINIQTFLKHLTWNFFFKCLAWKMLNKERYQLKVLKNHQCLKKKNANQLALNSPTNKIVSFFLFFSFLRKINKIVSNASLRHYAYLRYFQIINTV